MGPFITQESIDKAPWYFKLVFYILAFLYLGISLICVPILMGWELIKRWSK